ncbi:glycosyltransferase [Salinicola sp. V024]|uniref:glycosyltransferase n=1 Tax=Salinicola sp. V024 TaxID=3459609 RepID=UPI0040445E27
MKDFNVVGITRFNIVTKESRSWFHGTRNLSLEEAENKAFEYHSMKHRVDLLSSFALNTYQHLNSASDTSYGVVVISDNMPKEWKERVYDLVSVVNNVEILEIPVESQFKSEVSKYVISRFSGRKVFSYRLDDDDVLCGDYVEKIHELFKDARHKQVICFSDGYQMTRYGENDFRIVDRNWPNIGLGMGVFNLKDDGETILHMGSHGDMEKRHDFISIQGGHHWIRTLHSSNDSKTNRMKSPALTLLEAEKVLKDRFPHIDRYVLESMSIRDRDLVT